MSRDEFKRYLNENLAGSKKVKTRLAKHLGVHGSSVTKYFSGKALPSVDKVVRIARFFGDDPYDVLFIAGYQEYANFSIEGSEGIPGSDPSSAYRTMMKAKGQVPLIGHVAGGPMDLDFDFDDQGFPTGSADEYLKVEGAIVGENDYALRVTGDSLSPVYPNGTRILVSPTKKFVLNSLCVVRATAGRCWLKFVTLHGDTYTLSSINTSYPPFPLDRKEVKWIHSVKWISLP